MTEDRAFCAQCKLPLVGRRSRSAGELDYCCTGCRVAWGLAGDGTGSATDRLMARLILSAFLSVGIMVCSLALYGQAWGEYVGADMSGEAADAMRGVYRLVALALTTPVVWLLGVPLADAVINMRRWLSAEALVVLGVAAAFGVSTWNALMNRGEVYFETTAMVLVLVTLGRWIEARAKERARERLMGLLPEREAPAILLDGRTDSPQAEREIDAADLKVGDRVRVRPGSLIPADGIVLDGRAFVDTAALTGEANPKSIEPGDLVLAGTTPLDGALEVEVRASGEQRLFARVEQLLGEALGSRAKAARLADRAASVLLPLVLLLALGTVFFQAPRLGLEEALFAGLAVVLISCPCALGIATPLAFWVGLGEAWRHGVLVRGADTLEELAGAKRVYFDKTGTLAEEGLQLVKITTLQDSFSEVKALGLATALERDSEHPIAQAIRRAARERGLGQASLGLTNFRALPGVGVEGLVDGRRLRLVRDSGGANAGLTQVRLEELQGSDPAKSDSIPLALFALKAEARAEAAAVIKELKGQGFELTMLTGDAEGPARTLGDALGLPVQFELSPADKLAQVVAAGPGTVFIGDGLNDTAALAAASVGISVSQSVDRSLEAASVNLLKPGLSELPGLFRLAQRSLSVARLNLAWAFGYNALGLAFATTGRLSPIFAASAMVVSSAFVVLHSSRLRSGSSQTA